MSHRKFERQLTAIFEKLGFTAENLIEHHSPQLKRLKLQADLGDANFDATPRNEDEHPLTKTALYVIRRLRRFPLKASYAGIDLPPVESLLGNMVVDSPNAIREIDPSLLNDRLYVLSAVTHGSTLDCVPSRLRTKELCETAVSKSGRAIRDVPREILTHDMCWTAIRNKASIQDIAPEFHTEDMIVHCIKEAFRKSNYISRNFCTPDMLKKVVSADPQLINLMPRHMVTIDLCRAVIRKDKKLLHILPESFIEPIREEFMRSRAKSRYDDDLSLR